MSEVLGIVAEYNPFHNGHFYQVQKAKEKCGAKFVVCVMSGNFVQRGNTSIVDKWSKAQMALANGVDLVLELPTVYSVSSAENFAGGAVKILENLGIVDAISFGVETENVDALNNIAGILSEEPQEYTNMLKEELKKGVSFPSARQNALIRYLGEKGESAKDIEKVKNIENIKNGMNAQNDKNTEDSRKCEIGENSRSAEYKEILSMPNNILGIEYLKALKQLKSDIVPIVVKREKVSYDDDSIVDGFASATAIRKLLSKKDFKRLKKVVPQACYDTLLKEYELGDVVLYIQKFEKEILYALRKMSINDIADLPDVTEGLEHNIKDAVNLCNNIKDFMNMVKTKRYTQTRIQRILIFALLGITKKDVQMAKEVVPYARVLGFSQNGKTLLSRISQKNPQMEVITSVKKFMDNNLNETYKRMMEIDILATDVYTLECRNNSKANLDFTRNMIIRND